MKYLKVTPEENIDVENLQKVLKYIKGVKSVQLVEDGKPATNDLISDLVEQGLRSLDKGSKAELLTDLLGKVLKK